MDYFVKHFLILAGALCFATTAVAQQSDSESQVKAKVSTKEAEKKAEKKDLKQSNPTLNNLTGAGSGWRFQGTISHIPKLRRDQEDTTDVLGRADYSLNKKHRFRVQQYWNKVYGKYASEYEFQATDTQLAHFYRPAWKPLGASILLRNSLAVPISNASVRDNLITRYQASAIITEPLFGGKFIAFAVPYFRYHMYDFKTSVSGRPLPQFTYGASLSGLYFITSKLSVFGAMNYNYEEVTLSQFDQTPSQANSGIYRFDLDMSYQFNNALTASLGYFQGANYTQDGRYELVFYDDQVSRWSFGLTYIY